MLLIFPAALAACTPAADRIVLADREPPAEQRWSECRVADVDDDEEGLRLHGCQGLEADTFKGMPSERAVALPSAPIAPCPHP